ncbi:hypothetical protein [Microbulbifer epialgicus]|uniref:Uncharacterized protein n=1 Tax=Microbulbifer epialgicus TaxID=393907 RepID=A0ABV4P6F2_9GAMM
MYDKNEVNWSNESEPPTAIIKTGMRSKIDRLIKKTMEDNAIPGMAVAVISNPEMPVIWSKGH